MIGRFTTRRSAPEPTPVTESPPLIPAPMSWMPPAAVVPDDTPVAGPANPLLTDKLLDAKVRLHRRLIEEINLSALEKLAAVGVTWVQVQVPGDSLQRAVDAIGLFGSSVIASA